MNQEKIDNIRNCELDLAEGEKKYNDLLVAFEEFECKKETAYELAKGKKALAEVGLAEAKGVKLSDKRVDFILGADPGLIEYKLKWLDEKVKKQVCQEVEGICARFPMP